MVLTNVGPTGNNPGMDGLGSPTIPPAQDPALPNPKDASALVLTNDNPTGDDLGMDGQSQPTVLPAWDPALPDPEDVSALVLTNVTPPTLGGARSAMLPVTGK